MPRTPPGNHHTRSAWGFTNAVCPRCAIELPQPLLETAQYGSSFEEWSDRARRARRYTGTTAVGAFLQFVTLGPGYRLDAGRPWIELDCPGCGTVLYVRNPDGWSLRARRAVSVALGASAGAVSGWLWIMEIEPWHRM